MVSIDIVLIKDFSILALTLITEPFRLANRELRRREFSWRLITPGGQSVISSSGIELHVDGDLDDKKANVVIVISSSNVEGYTTKALLSWLRRRARHGVMVGCVDTAAYFLARAGLLFNRSVAAHFEVLPHYRQKFPKSQFTDLLFQFAPPFFSSAGGVATFDVILALIAHFCTPELARRVARILNYDPLEQDRRQIMFPHEVALVRGSERLFSCVALMLENIETPLSLAELSKRTGTPIGQIHRLFKKHLNRTPFSFYTDIRLDHARTLLLFSNEKVGSIATLCGYDNHETFSRMYRKRFNTPPSRDRRVKW